LGFPAEIDNDDVVGVNTVGNVGLLSILVSEVCHGPVYCAVFAWRFNGATWSVTVWIELDSGRAKADGPMFGLECFSMDGNL
jgi:hypothetical protein